MNFFVAIVTAENRLFSTIKPQTAKMVNAMKALCDEYKELFKGEYKVVRFIQTRKGFKRV